MLTEEKINKLKAVISHYKNAVISLSGGTDSVAMAAVAKNVLGAENVVTATAITAFLTDTEKNAAQKASEALGVTYMPVRIHLMNVADIVKNDKMRCYHCKRVILSHIDELRKKAGFDVVFDGGNVTDLGDYRPGLKAVEEFGIVSPFKEAGFTKEDIAELLKKYNMQEYILPSNSCLATRIKTGQQIDLYHLRMICAAETYITNLGYSHVRCRVDGNKAKIQVDPSEVDEALAHEEELVFELRMMGFEEVTIDKDGYKRAGITNV